MGCSPRLEKGRRWVGAVRPQRSRGGSAELQCAAAAARVRGASVGWGQRRVRGPNKGNRRELACVPGLAQESWWGPGGSGSCTTAPRDTGSGGGASRKKGEARSRAGVRAQVRCRGAAPECSGVGPRPATGGRASRERNRGEGRRRGKKMTRGPRLAEGERERRHATLGSGQGGKGGERSGDGPPEKKKAGPRGKREPGRAAEKRRGKATRVRKEREGLGLLG
jgi:hypothetical protein